MARDGRDSDRDDFGFVDRDDDRDDGLVDADYDDGFPGEPGEAMEDAPDPGYAAYAAYAEEFEDPLADWPSPDRPLDELPERRRAQERAAHDNRSGREAIDSYAAAGDSADGRETVGEKHPEDGPDDSDDRLQALDPTEAFSRDANPVSTQASFDEDPLSSPTPERSDSDADIVDDAWLAADRDDEPLRADDARGEAPARGQPVSRAPAEDEEDFIDDFLNDLDDIDETDTYRAAISGPRGGGTTATSPDVDDVPVAARAAHDSAAAQMGAAALAGAASMARGKNIDRDAPMRSARDVPGENSDGGSRLIPWVMVAVVVLALVLLAVGGYGVVKQRSELEAQIRDLQAQLATAVTTEEVAAERELQRQVELENEALAAELEGLQAENAALAQDIATLEERLEEQEAEAAQEAQQTAEAAAAAQRAAAQRETAAASGRSTESTGPWFVNFGSYAQRDIAQRWASRLEVDDGEVVVQSAEAAGRTLFRVRVVGLASQDRAERVATTLERAYQLPRLWVGRN